MRDEDMVLYTSDGEGTGIMPWGELRGNLESGNEVRDENDEELVNTDNLELALDNHGRASGTHEYGTFWIVRIPLKELRRLGWEPKTGMEYGTEGREFEP